MTGNLTLYGSVLKGSFGPDMAIIMIFFCSGLSLDSNEFKSGIQDFYLLKKEEKRQLFLWVHKKHCPFPLLFRYHFFLILD